MLQPAVGKKECGKRRREEFAIEKEGEGMVMEIGNRGRGMHCSVPKRHNGSWQVAVALSERTLPSLPEISEIVEALKKLSYTNRYLDTQLGPVRVMIRYSVCHRRLALKDQEEVLDYDIVQISLPREFIGCGLGSEFFLRMVDASYSFAKRGVFLENAITNGSRGMMENLCKRGLALPASGNSSFLSTFPPRVIFLPE